MRKFIEVTLCVGGAKKIINVGEIVLISASVRRYSEDGMKQEFRTRGSVILTRDGLFIWIKEEYANLKEMLFRDEEKK